MTPILKSTFDVFEVPAGLAVIGTNPDLDPYPVSWFDQLKGKTIRFQNLNGTIVICPILDVKITSSLVGLKNIAFLLPLEWKGKIYTGAEVTIL